jgi:hypothetical protein
VVKNIDTGVIYLVDLIRYPSKGGFGGGCPSPCPSPSVSYIIYSADVKVYIPYSIVHAHALMCPQILNINAPCIIIMIQARLDITGIGSSFQFGVD